MSDLKKQIKKRIKNLQSLPTLPPIVGQLTRLIADERSTAQQVAALIERDQVLTSKVLKMVNSAFYGFPRRISTVSNAIVLLGFNVVRTLVITASIFETMQAQDLSLWEHSLGTAAAAGLLAGKLELKNPEEVTTAGLLHDIGKVVLRTEFPEILNQIEKTVQEKGIYFREAEQEVIGIDHGEIGRLLANQWNLPERLVEPIAYHHEVEKARKFKKETAIVHFADIMVRAVGYGSGGDPWVPPLNDKAWKLLRLTDNDLAELIPIFDEKLIELRLFTLEMQNEMAK
ncbi:metal dependent phosphohydrolase [Thermodesulfatator indicus DSM 15286]|uniref:Metal dependent phosphohydrolase n=1 Tax=Thermodesulfatator indicus (strain DSM 15286 / JCM 11887 / CIR29812) TaxID=667014 RepID=F8AB33_THEID|nr:HDOD domain-containing protein [Thermodesulfatator indicus]AEH44402.1 metal dependent phosphohydrolase [Thermodesulfatator indicus DSM 15286]